MMEELKTLVQLLPEQATDGHCNKASKNVRPLKSLYQYDRDGLRVHHSSTVAPHKSVLNSLHKPTIDLAHQQTSRASKGEDGCTTPWAACIVFGHTSQKANTQKFSKGISCPKGFCTDKTAMRITVIPTLRISWIRQIRHIGSTAIEERWKPEFECAYWQKFETD